MFVIFKFARPAGNKKYMSYEQARQAVRKRLRKLYPGSWNRGENPDINGFGYTVRRV